MTDKTVKEIVHEFLEANKKDFDGLVADGGECACLTEDLFPCDDDAATCIAGHKTECPCDYDDMDNFCGEHDWHITAGPRPVPPKPDCYKCVHRLPLVGNCHSRCNNVKAIVTGNEHGINSGWFFWPLNYDPIWLESCDGFSDDPKDKLPPHKFDPLIELFSLLK